MPPQSPSESPVSFNQQQSSTENILLDLQRSSSPAKKQSNDQKRSNDHHMKSDDSAAAPSSVYLGSAITLNRELSDLSGSYVNGAANSRSGAKGGGAVPGHIYDDTSAFKGPWRHAFVLTEQPPPQQVSHQQQLLQQQQQYQANGGSSPKVARDATILVDRNDTVEVVKRQDSTSDQSGSGGLATSTLDTLHGHHVASHPRIPVMLVLMDPSRKTYEIMQLWADRSTDSVRDIVNTMQQSIPVKWKQAYDGVFQMRGNKLTQLIHILSLEKYEVQPHEILVAKPWSMPSTVTIAYATSLVRHLTNIGMVSSSDSDICGKRIFRPNKSVDAALILSVKAQSRIFAPEGMLNHHHAVQFVTFSPPLDPNRMPVDIHSERVEGGSNSSVSLSHAGSIDSDPVFKLKVKNSTITAANSVADVSTLSPGSRPQQRHGSPTTRRAKANKSRASFPSLPLETTAEHQPRRSLFSKLKCCRNKDDNTNNGASSVMSPVLTLTEEQQQRWSTFDITGPIAEDNSVAGYSAQSSTVSMSAPLLLSSSQPRRVHHDHHRGSSTKRWATKADF